MRNFTSLLLLTCLLQCSEPEKNPPEAETEMILSVLNGIIEADNGGDANEVIFYYSEDAVLIPPDRPAVQGQASIYDHYKKTFETSVVNFSIQVSELKSTSDWAMATGTTQGTVTIKSTCDSENCPHVEVNDRYMMLLKKVDNSWKISKLIWNHAGENQ